MRLATKAAFAESSHPRVTRRRHATDPQITSHAPAITLRLCAVHKPECHAARDVANGIALDAGAGMSLLDALTAGSASSSVAVSSSTTHS